ncbi:unnamed protein product [Microthlaspi erraticum]|uniref:Cullin family profile domain-containing protein n=1 Tax=Microthlaspi erraticum TaxID=1685480 RepID=A0A6D2IXG8_9BRAS|nr:unnamed protein product [Microthlaspi erraticum]
MTRKKTTEIRRKKDEISDKKAIVSSESKHKGERLIDLKQWREDPKRFELNRRKSHRETAEKTQESGKKKMRKKVSTTPTRAFIRHNDLRSDPHDGFWPAQPTVPCNLPAEVCVLCEKFKSHYLGTHNGRRLSWQTNMGTADVKATFGKAHRHELNVSVELSLKESTAELTSRPGKQRPKVEPLLSSTPQAVHDRAARTGRQQLAAARHNPCTAGDPSARTGRHGPVTGQVSSAKTYPSVRPRRPNTKTIGHDRPDRTNGRLRSERRETVWFLSTVGVKRELRGQPLPKARRDLQKNTSKCSSLSPDRPDRPSERSDRPEARFQARFTRFHSPASPNAAFEALAL